MQRTNNEIINLLEQLEEIKLQYNHWTFEDFYDICKEAQIDLLGIVSNRQVKNLIKECLDNHCTNLNDFNRWYSEFVYNIDTFNSNYYKLENGLLFELDSKDILIYINEVIDKLENEMDLSEPIK